MTLALRPYQRAALDAQYSHWDAGGGNSLVELATGTGKSLVAATLSRETLKQFPGLRIGVFTHVSELIEQNCLEMLRLWPQAPVGIYSAGLGRRDARAQILFGGIQSIHDKSDVLGAFDLILIDECHLVPRKADTMYGRFLAANAAKTAKTGGSRLVGLTATPYRLDSGRLDQGEDAMFEKIVYSYDIARGIADGYLSPLVSKAGLAEIDTSGVHTRGGEFVPGELEAAALENGNVEEACAETAELGRNRHKWLAFCVGVKHAHAVTDAMKRRGIAAATVTGETPKGERGRLIKDFHAGRIRCLTSVGVLTTGFNVPGVDLIAMLNPTKSAGKYMQIVGRGTRLIDGRIGHLPTADERIAAIAASAKPDCVILDFAGNIREHGPVDDIRAKDAPKKKEPGAPIVIQTQKQCPDCESLSPLQTRTCPKCGYQFSNGDNGPGHDGTADGTVSILKSAAVPFTRTVKEWHFYRHEKPGAVPSLRIEYNCGLSGLFTEWVCLEHARMPGAKARQVWRQLGDLNKPLPQTIDEALSRINELKMPAQIEIKQEGKYFRVTKRIMNKNLVTA